jgi:pimeloyl-ACP methyl ester carboxylesterase
MHDMTLELNRVTLDDGMTLTYRELGSGAPVLLLHGWPTSSYLWRNVMPAIAEHNSVIAVDLPGFGGSDKPVGVRYSFDFYARAIDGLLAKLEMDRIGLVVHDLGAPIGLHWMVGNRDRVSRLAFLNVLVYPDFGPEVIEFVKTLAHPDTREKLVGTEGLTQLTRDGLADKSKATDELLAAVLGPFRDASAKEALALAGTGLGPEGFQPIVAMLPTLDLPVRIIYGERDELLTDIADTVAHLAKDLPQAEITALPHCGHFLQEDDPEQVGRLLAEFFKG